MAISLITEGLYLDREALDRRGLQRVVVEQELAALLKDCPSVAHVYTDTELESGGIADAPYGQLFVNGHHPERSPDLEVRFVEDFLESRTDVASHGSPYRYDTHVPMVLMVPGARPRRIERPVRTVDLAPTLAALVGVQPPAGIDGEDSAARGCVSRLPVAELRVPPRRPRNLEPPGSGRLGRRHGSGGSRGRGGKKARAALFSWALTWQSAQVGARWLAAFPRGA